jgi:hypothetical protein
MFPFATRPFATRVVGCIRERRRLLRAIEHKRTESAAWMNRLGAPGAVRSAFQNLYERNSGLLARPWDGALRAVCADELAHDALARGVYLVAMFSARSAPRGAARDSRIFLDGGGFQPNSP